MVKKTISKKNTLSHFEQNLNELETLIQEMEDGNLSLEKSLQNFEKGIKLTRSCQRSLKDAEQKMELLVANEDTDVLEPFQPEDDK